MINEYKILPADVSSPSNWLFASQVTLIVVWDKPFHSQNDASASGPLVDSLCHN